MFKIINNGQQHGSCKKVILLYYFTKLQTHVICVPWVTPIYIIYMEFIKRNLLTELL
jgi:hypothetical protein